MPRERILFITGRLAEPALRRVLAGLSADAGFDYDVAVLGISVAALMNVDFVLRKLTVTGEFQRAILPGWCQGDREKLESRWQMSFELGPKDLHDLPDHFGKRRELPADFGRYDIEILAEINHAPRIPPRELLAQALQLKSEGADIIDLGCVPGEQWMRVGHVTRQLCEAGLRVSIDSFDQAEVELAVTAGAELVLSVNRSNCGWAAHLPAELVVIPDEPHELLGLPETVGYLQDVGAKFRVDPILEPISFGFAASLGRYLSVRQQYPEVPMMMGIGNLTELTEVDSSGVNVLLAGFCEEQRIHSVLTTQVISWCQSAVKEFDLARKLMYHAVHKQVLPKHVDGQLVVLRDPKVRDQGADTLAELAQQIKDANFRIFAERGEIHLINRDGYWHGTDPFELFDQLPEVDASHAFYLGYELAKAVTALTLGKQYRQDEALRWGFLTVPEVSAQERRHKGRE